MLHHAYVSLHGDTTVTSITTPGQSRWASGRMLVTVRNRTNAAQTVALEAADDSTAATWTSLAAGASKTIGVDLTPQDYKFEYGASELLTVTVFGIARVAPTEAKAAVITTTQKHVGETVTVTSPAAFNSPAAPVTTTFQWQRAASPFSSWSDIADTVATAATLSTALTGTNNDLKFTAVTPGIAGNNISVTYTDPGGTTAALSVSVSGTDITVHLGRAASAINTTGTLLAAAVAAFPAAAALVTVANVAANDGTGLVTALTKTNLAGGLDTVDADSATEGAGYECALLDVNDKVRLKTTATTTSEGSVVSYSNASGVVLA